MGGMQDFMVQAIRAKFTSLEPVLDERVCRLWAATEARAIGRGGITRVAEATGLSRVTIRAGPMSPLRWTCKSAAKLAAELQVKGHAVSERTVHRLLHALDYSLQSNRKTIEGKSHPDRDAQFQYINRRVKAFQRQGQPVV